MWRKMKQVWILLLSVSLPVPWKLIKNELYSLAELGIDSLVNRNGMGVFNLITQLRQT